MDKTSCYNTNMEADGKIRVIIVSPSLDPKLNVSGVSSVVNLIVNCNKSVQYIHFQQGKTDTERGGKLNRLKRILESYASWKQLLKKDENALIHYNMSMDAKSIIRDVPFIRYACRHKRSVLVHIHGGKYLFYTKRPLFINVFLKELFRLKLPVVVLSNEEKWTIQKEFQHNDVQVLPNVVDLREASSFTREYSYSKKRLDILFIGRITEDKGINYIISACKTLKEEGLNFILHIAGKEQGKADYIGQLKSALGDSFLYEGIVFGKAKAELLKQCDIFLLPSYYEGLPMSLLEAMSFAEVPVVTDVGSINTVVKDKYNGLLVKVKDSQSIVEAVKLLICKEDFRKNLSVNAQSTIFEKYNPDKYINQINDLYNRILIESRVK
jgi:glycosyltransferase involved in cell wall biosynthesis